MKKIEYIGLLQAENSQIKAKLAYQDKLLLKLEDSLGVDDVFGDKYLDDLIEIVHKIGLSATLENLAEECSELAQAALKYARFLRWDNPTPKTEKECIDALNEEAADVGLVIDVLTAIGMIDVRKMNDIKVKKKTRWQERLRDTRA